MTNHFIFYLGSYAWHAYLKLQKEILQVKLYISYFSFQALYCLVGFGDDTVQILMDQFECYVSNPDVVKAEWPYL